MFALKKLRDSFYDIAPEIELDRDVGILVRFIDPGADGKPHNITIEKHGSQPNGRVGPHVFGSESLFKKPQDLAQSERAFRYQIEAIHPGGGGNLGVEVLPHVNLNGAIQHS
jgi:hypothetical protein